MGSFWDQGPTQDFNLGGFAPAPSGDPQIQNDLGLTGPYNFQQSDPRLVPQQPGSDFGMPKNWGDPGSAPMPSWFDPNAPSFNDPKPPPEMMRQWEQQNAPGTPNWQRLMGGGSLGQMGFTSGSIGNGGGTQGPMGNGGFYAPPAIAKGPNGFINPGNGSPYQGTAMSSLGQMGGMQRANPAQQSGQVGMRSPDGQHFQYVNAEHVPHYQGLGAQVVNGSSYGGGNG